VLTNGSTVIVNKSKDAAIYVPGDTTKNMELLSAVVYSSVSDEKAKANQLVRLADGSTAAVLKVYEDKETGFKAAAYKLPDGRVAVAYAGTNDEKDKIAWRPFIDPSGLASVSAGGLVKGPEGMIDAMKWRAEGEAALRKQVEQAQAFYNSVVTDSRVNREKIVVTGHSLGGALAQAVGAKHGVETHAYNAPGMANFLAKENIPVANNNKITNHARSTDVVGNRLDHIGHVIEYAKDRNVFERGDGKIFDKAADHDMSKFAEDIAKGTQGTVTVDKADVLLKLSDL